MSDEPLDVTTTTRIMVDVILGSGFIFSEILPFVKTTKYNGILQFVWRFVKNRFIANANPTVGAVMTTVEDSLAAFSSSVEGVDGGVGTTPAEGTVGILPIGSPGITPGIPLGTSGGSAGNYIILPGNMFNGNYPGNYGMYNGNYPAGGNYFHTLSTKKQYAEVATDTNEDINYINIAINTENLGIDAVTTTSDVIDTTATTIDVTEGDPGPGYSVNSAAHAYSYPYTMTDVVINIDTGTESPPEIEDVVIESDTHNSSYGDTVVDDENENESTLVANFDVNIENDSSRVLQLPADPRRNSTRSTADVSTNTSLHSNYLHLPDTGEILAGEGVIQSEPVSVVVVRDSDEENVDDTGND